jgi:hypothetical protein
VAIGGGGIGMAQRKAVAVAILAFSTIAPTLSTAVHAVLPTPRFTSICHAPDPELPSGPAEPEHCRVAMVASEVVEWWGIVQKSVEVGWPSPAVLAP